jgi:hypothetical protein
MKIKSFLRISAAVAFVVAGTAAGTGSAVAATGSTAIHPHSAISESAVVVTPDYTAGTAKAYAPTYTPQMHWHCSFSGWAGVTVDYDCNVQDTSHVVLAHERGSFTGPSFTTATYTHTFILGVEYCTQAVGAYADGSSSASSRVCP